MMAELTVLESKFGEVTGLAMAAQVATSTVIELADGEAEELVSALEKMRLEAIETERRCTELAGTFEGKRPRSSTRPERRRARARTCSRSISTRTPTPSTASSS
jgi:hypothetical protein